MSGMVTVREYWQDTGEFNKVFVFEIEQARGIGTYNLQQDSYHCVIQEVHYSKLGIGITSMKFSSRKAASTYLMDEYGLEWHWLIPINK